MDELKQFKSIISVIVAGAGLVVTLAGIWKQIQPDVKNLFNSCKELTKNNNAISTNK